MGTLTFLSPGKKLSVPDDPEGEREAVAGYPDLWSAVEGSRNRRVAGEESGVSLEELEARYGITPPDPARRPSGRRPKGDSGNVRVRMPRRLHRELSEQADREGVSLNALILTYLAREAGIRSAQLAEGQG